MIYDVVICGGGPAGTAAAITAARLGARVLLLERGRYPRHKVCGEFVSAESLSLLSSLAGSHGEVILAGAPRIGKARIFSDGAVVDAAINPAAASIARHELDLALWLAAEAAGAVCRQQVSVTGIERIPLLASQEVGHHTFRVRSDGETFAARAVVDASGRWSNLKPADLQEADERWLGVKAHFAVEEDAASVDLYFFRSGYCGVQPIGGGRVNACAMVRADALPGRQSSAGSKSNGQSTRSLMEQVFALHPQLHERSGRWRQATEVVTTSPLVFRQPAPEFAGVLRAGDAAGFIDPFAGDGISLALQTGAAAARALSQMWTAGAALQTVCEEYQTFYQESLLPVFGNAGRVRRLLGMPGILRRPLLGLLQASGLADLLVQKTRLNWQNAPVGR